MASASATGREDDCDSSTLPTVSCAIRPCFNPYATISRDFANQEEQARTHCAAVTTADIPVPIISPKASPASPEPIPASLEHNHITTRAQQTNHVVTAVPDTIPAGEQADATSSFLYGLLTGSPDRSRSSVNLVCTYF